MPSLNRAIDVEEFPDPKNNKSWESIDNNTLAQIEIGFKVLGQTSETQ